MASVLDVFWQGVQVEVLGRQGGTSKTAPAIVTSPPLKAWAMLQGSTR